MDGDRRPLGRGLDRDLGADASAAAGDQDDPTGQRSGHQPTPDRVPRSRRSTGPAGGGAVDPRMTSSVGSTSPAGPPPASRPSAKPNARRPISCSGSRTVDRPGVAIAAIWMSSNPAMETSSRDVDAQGGQAAAWPRARAGRWRRRRP